jgi:hypothetical protein
MSALSQFAPFELRDLTALTRAGHRANLITAPPQITQAATARGKI